LTEASGYDIVATNDVLIPLSDGVRLAANLLLPVNAGPVPAIVVYFPYLKDLHGLGPIRTWQRHFARRGYACLTVDMRGTGASEGTPAPCFAASEKEDAAEMLASIASQPWCNGVTGMWGISYSGSSALAAASLNPPSLKAIVPMHGTANEFLGFLWPHGCRPAWWTEASWGPMMTLLALLPPLHRDPDRRWASVWHERLARVEPPPFAWHRTPFETYMGWQTDASAVRAATYAVSGWHDYYPQATLDYFNAIPAPKRVMIGPWKHEFPDLAVNGAIDHLSEMDRWWDRWLKGIESGIERDPPVMIWRQGDAVWGYEETWPPTGAQIEEWFAADGGQLTRARPSDAGADRHHVDPSVGLHLLPWDPQAPVVPMPYDRSADDHRALTYTSAPFSADVELLGQPEAVVALSSDVAELPLSVHLTDVAATGHSTLICQGWVSAARASGGRLGSDEVSEITVPLYSTAYRLPAGHRLRLVIAGADFPLLWPAVRNPTLTVHRSPVHATRVRVPIAPLRPLPLAQPVFGRPAVTTGEDGSIERWDNRVIRDLAGESASFEQHTETTRRLEDGTMFRSSATNTSTIPTARPADTVLTTNLDATLDYPEGTAVTTVKAVQTRERYHIHGRITIAGKPFFDRSWELPLT
jgi:predicted acyl esterase